MVRVEMNHRQHGYGLDRSRELHGLPVSKYGNFLPVPNPPAQRMHRQSQCDLGTELQEANQKCDIETTAEASSIMPTWYTTTRRQSGDIIIFVFRCSMMPKFSTGTQ